MSTIYFNDPMMTAKKQSCSKPELPVSRKFYNTLLSRVDEILLTIFQDSSAEYFTSAKNVIDDYLEGGLQDSGLDDVAPEIRIIFLTLKAEIDRAILRSRRARKAARLRKAKCRKHSLMTSGAAVRHEASAETTSEPAETDTCERSYSDMPSSAPLTPGIPTSCDNSTPLRDQQLRDRSRHTRLRWKPATPPGRPHRYRPNRVS
ncbi:MAG: hypothetical protein HDS49_05745 [Bacteroides sp.]|nr:hypothetical protein [Bacteroides sp.]